MRRRYFARRAADAPRFDAKQIKKIMLLLLGLLAVLLALVLASVMGESVDREAAMRPVVEKGVLRIGVRTDIAGMNQVLNGVHTGFEADVANEVARRILQSEGLADTPVELIEINTKSMKLMVQDGDVDFALGCFIEDDTQTSLDYSSPYFMDACLFLTSGAVTDAGRIGDGIVGVVSKSYAADHLEDYLETRGIETTLQTFASYQDAVYALDHGRVDAVCGSGVMLNNYVSWTSQAVFLPEAVLKHGYRVVSAGSRYDFSILVNDAIVSMYQDGTLSSLIAKWGLTAYWNLGS